MGKNIFGLWLPDTKRRLAPNTTQHAQFIGLTNKSLPAWGGAVVTITCTGRTAAGPMAAANWPGGTEQGVACFACGPARAPRRSRAPWPNICPASCATRRASGADQHVRKFCSWKHQYFCLWPAGSSSSTRGSKASCKSLAVMQSKSLKRVPSERMRSG